MTVAIIGLGYVGLPLCLQFARSGVRVLGLDIDAKKVRSLNACRSYIHHIPADEIKRSTCGVENLPRRQTFPKSPIQRSPPY